jgi:hypothetical protein
MAQTAQTAEKNSWAYAYREAVTRFMTAWEDMENLQAEFDARGFSGNITDDDLVGANAGFTYTLLANALGSHGAVETVMAAGHGTNFQSIRVR